MKKKKKNKFWDFVNKIKKKPIKWEPIKLEWEVNKEGEIVTIWVKKGKRKPMKFVREKKPPIIQKKTYTLSAGKKIETNKDNDYLKHTYEERKEN